jgi:manganese transport protein
MKGFHITTTTQVISWIIALIIVSLNAKLVYDEITSWLETSNNPIIIWLTVVPLAFGFLALLLYIVFKPFVTKAKSKITNHSPHNLNLQFTAKASQTVKNIAISVDFSNADEAALNHAFELGGMETQYTLIHIVETVGALMYGTETHDHETTIDEKLLLEYQDMLTKKGFKIEIELGFGKPNTTIPKIINAGNFDILVMGTHGHTGLKDILFGTTVDKLRHKISIPLLIVKK